MPGRRLRRGLQFLLGEAAFEAVAHDYIDEHPSRSPSLNGFGRSMAPFLAERADAVGAAGVGAFAADLARVEWAIVEAIHAAPSPPLTLDRFEHMTPDQWATASGSSLPRRFASFALRARRQRVLPGVSRRRVSERARTDA